MKLTSPAFNHNQNIPSKFTCDGEGVSPALVIFDVPKEAQSLALVVDDPDAMKGTFTHWLVWNIKPETKEIAEETVPEDAVEGMTDFEKSGWEGPCPPSGAHHYQFKLYALDSVLDLDPSTQKTNLEKAMAGHVLAETTLVGLYKKTS